MPLKINAKTLALYCAYAIVLLCINVAIPQVPFSLGLCFAMLICGANIFACPAIYILAGAVHLSYIYSLLNLFEGAFLCAVTFIYRKANKKIRVEAAAYLSVALAPFIAFSSWQGEAYFGILQNAYLMRAVAAICVIVFSFFCFKSVYTLFFRLCRCKPRSDELICIVVVFTLFGAGLYSLIGNYVYISIAAGCIIFAVRLFKNPSAVIVALVLSLPIAISTLSVNYLTAFIIFSIIVLVFCNTGRGAESAAGLATCALYFYLNGAFTVGAGIAAVRALLLICCLLLPALLSDKKLEYLLRLLTVKRVMPEAMKNSYKFLMSEKLFKISQVFREIECAFSQTEEEIDEKEVKLRIFSDLKEKCCTSCERREKCAKSNVYSGFSRLIDCGCIKGKVNLVDLPESVTVNCSFPTDVITYLNKLLADYRRFNIEAENMKSGRKLLANQAKGVSEVLKNCATEFARRQENMEDKQNLLLKKLSERGIICYEIQFSGENADDVYIITEEKPKLAAIRQTLFECTGKNFILKDKQIYDGQKCCLIFTSPPLYDAAFGVAFAIKEGEKLSGDTHSVIKINEHSFLIVLSDGMGSGEYAKKVSATAISLIEAFYRAEMPTDTVLDTINKLICFNRDERFTCIDIAQINLNTLESAFIKIGSPAGVIVRTGEIKVLEAGSLPLGILESIKPKTCKEQLKEGDIVVFMSDGITSAFPSATDLYEFLSTLKPLNPQSLADKILARALESAGSATDDMTVLCTRIFKRVTD